MNDTFEKFVFATFAWPTLLLRWRRHCRRKHRLRPCPPPCRPPLKRQTDGGQPWPPCMRTCGLTAALLAVVKSSNRRCQPCLLFRPGTVSIVHERSLPLPYVLCCRYTQGPSTVPYSLERKPYGTFFSYFHSYTGCGNTEHRGVKDRELP
jgi:hypothetical protein